MKRRSCLTLLMVFCLMTTLTGYAFAAQFTDTKGHWAESQITKWADSGLASGYANSTFKPNGQVTRAEFVALVNRAFNINKATTGATDFKDVKTGNWFYADVMAAKAAGYTGGYSNGTFKPNQTITRQEVASILTRLLSLSPASTNLDQFKDAQSIQNWAQASVGAVVNSGLMGGYTDSTFKPLKSITRAEAVVSLDRAMGYQPGTVVTNSAIVGKVSFMGSGIANATVKVFSTDGYSVLQTATTDNNGSYKLNLEPGKYDLTATTSDKVAYKSDVTVNANQVATVNMTMDSAAVLSGTLKDKNNNLLKNCTMYFTTNPTFVITTDSSGNFTLPVLANHVYNVRALDPSKTDEAPVVINSALTVGASGNHKTGTLNTPFAIKSSGGGGGGSGGSSTNNHVYNDDGTYGPTSGTQTITGDVAINVTGVTLQNTTITGNLTLAAGIGAGDVTLNNVTVQGSTFINGGGSHSVHLNNCTLASVVIDKEGVHVVAEGSTTVTTVDLKTMASLESTGQAITFQGITVQLGVTGNIILKGKLGNVTVAASGVTVTVESGTVNNLTVTNSATGANIALDSDVNVTNLNLNSASSSVTGSGIVTTAKAVNANSIHVTTINNPIIIPSYPAEATLSSLLDATQAVLTTMTDTQWETLQTNRNNLLAITDYYDLIKSLRNLDLDQPFQNLINTHLTINDKAKVKTSLDLIISLSGNKTLDREEILQHVSNFKNTYSAKISKLIARGVTQQNVYNYGQDLYNSILAGTYTLNKSTYETDLYTAALKVLNSKNTNGTYKYTELHKLASDSFEKLKNDYTSKSTGPLADLINCLTIDDISGNILKSVKDSAENTIREKNDSNLNYLLDFADFVLEFSQDFLPAN